MCENLAGPDPIAVMLAIQETFGITIPEHQ